MRQRLFGSTGLSVAELSLGTWGLSGEAYGPVPEEEARHVLERARAMGIELFETSASYGRGRMEALLGEVFAGDEGALFVTKWGTNLEARPARKQFDVEFLQRQAEESLRRLNSRRVFALLHNPSLTALQEGTALRFLQECTQRGDLLGYGVSVSDEKSVAACLEAQVPVLSVPYNIFHVQCVRPFLEQLEQKQTALLVHSVLSYGLLAGRWAPGKQFSPEDHRFARWPDGSLRSRIQHLDAVRPLVSGDVPSMRAAALRFALVPPVVKTVILGPKNRTQLDQLVREAQVEGTYLSEQKLSGLEGRLSHLGLR